MKKIFTLTAVAMLMAAPALLTSCDDDPWYEPPYDDWDYSDQWWSGYNGGSWGWNDDNWKNGGYYNGGGYTDNDGNTVLDEAEVLNGEWDGEVTYTYGDTGEQDEFYANMTFVRDDGNAIKGTGTEIDYLLDSNGNETNVQSPLKFNWYIDESTGDIYIHYTNTENKASFVMDISASQHGFRLVEGQYFRGYMIGTNNRDMAYINLNRVTSSEAKSATRASSAANRSFGSDKVEALSGGTQRLNNRR